MHPQVVAVVVHLATDASALRHAPFGNVEPGADLDNVDQRDELLVDELVAVDVPQAAIDAKPEPRAGLVAFEVDVAGAFGNGIEQDGVE